jgi:hypothetical protein
MSLSDIVAKGRTQFEKLEKGLDNAKKACLALEKTYIESYKAQHIKGDATMTRITSMGIIRGKIAEVEALVYAMHAADTAKAQALGEVPVGPYAVLGAPDGMTTMDGGGGR